ncbi:MAG: TRAP transporter substrate-binding protein [Alphaproteobacteria bacterium]|nr:TRAP transporter substrate-binding protein [Alphaproteobacteria bacterium]
MSKQRPSSRKISRRQVVKISAGLAAGAIIGAPAIVRSQQAKRFFKPIVVGLNGKEGDPSHVSVSRIPEILRKKYDVEMDFHIYTMSTVGTDVYQLEAVQTGFIDITSHATPQFSLFSDKFSFVDLPYAITDWDMALRLFKSDLWKKQAAGFESEVPVKVLPPVGAGGFRLLWNNIRALPAPDAVDGLKFRTLRSPLSIALIQNWGGIPTPLPWTETFQALKVDVVDGIHVQPIWTFQFDMHEVLKYATEVNAIFSVLFQVMNINTFNAMPESMREVFMLAAQEAAYEATEQDRRLENFYKRALTKAGMEIYTPTAAEANQWTVLGEAVWETEGKDVDRGVLNELMALRA